MLAWQVPYLGWRHFPAELSEFEISRFFTFEPEVHRAIRSRYKDTLRLGVALQLGFLTMCGRTLHAFQRVPAELLKHLGEQMEIPAPDIATLRALYKNRRATLFEDQAWSIEFLGFMRFEMTDSPKILPALRDVVKAGVNGDPLLASARRLLHEHRFVIPGTRRLGSLVQLAVQSVEREVLAGIDRKIPLHIRTQWLETLYSTQPGSEATLLEWSGWKLFWRLKSRPGRPSIPIEMQALICRMGKENPSWGEERIANELLVKLGIQVSPRTVNKYLPRRPRRRPKGNMRWSTFLRLHARGIIACDFFVAVSATFHLPYVFVVIEHGSPASDPVMSKNSDTFTLPLVRRNSTSHPIEFVDRCARTLTVEYGAVRSIGCQGLDGCARDGNVPSTHAMHGGASGLRSVSVLIGTHLLRI